MGRRSCRAGALVLAALLAAAPAAAARTTKVRSFDGTRLTVNFFPAAGLDAGERAPTVLQGPGWSSPGGTDPNAPTSPGGGVVGVGALRRAGYNVLTWDPRGFGTSGGRVTINDARFEGRDVSALIDYVDRQPESLLDGPRDPRVGMTGGSYGGGIQLVAAAIDDRIDAIVPVIAWHRLSSSLYERATVKNGWSDLLYAAAVLQKGRLDPRIVRANEEAGRDRVLSRPSERFFASRGPGRLVRRIRAPTLILQGTVDTLFPLDEAVTNYRILRRNRVPVKMVWFCGGHGLCLTSAGNRERRIERVSLDWLARYLKLRGSVRTGPRFEWVDQRGRSSRARDYPLPAARPLAGTGRGTLGLTADGGSGPYEGPGLPSGALSLVGNTIGTRAANAVEVPIRSARRATVLGAPRLEATYRGRAAGRGRVLAQVVDEATGLVLGNQVTPVALVLDGRRRTVRVPLEIVAAHARPGARFTVQLVAQSSLYDLRPRGGSVAFARIRAELPVVR